LLPVCAAVTVQFPAAIDKTVAPEVVQMFGVEELKVTVKPESADAARAIVLPTV